MQPTILFLTLRTFSATGGIEKMCRLAGKALADEAVKQGVHLSVYSAYDETGDIEEKYFSAAVFRGFGGNRKLFSWQSFRSGLKASVVLLSHINLLPVGYAIKRISPATKLVLLAHGIEVWCSLPAWKRHMLHQCDRILPVSEFTKQKMVTLHGLPKQMFRVVNNCIDPFLPPPAGGKNGEILHRYGWTGKEKIFLTLARLSAKEQNKGYESVIKALGSLKGEEPLLRYLVVGKWDQEEKERLERLIKKLGVEDRVALAGFVPDQELPDYFTLADGFIMPSKKEGFGIVFIEALYYGLPVIAGNRDGSVDALAGGKFGILVDPENEDQLKGAIVQSLQQPLRFIPKREEVLAHFGFPVYKKAIWREINLLCGAGHVHLKKKDGSHSIEARKAGFQ